MDIKTNKSYLDIKNNIVRFLHFKGDENVLLVGDDVDSYCRLLQQKVKLATSYESELDSIDTAILVGDFADVEALIMRLKQKLSDRGYFVIACENRMGLSYLAGRRDDTDGDFFSGIEGKSKAHTQKEWRALLTRCGLNDYEFFYPYPDYKLPLCIYSDKFLPKKEELNRNIWNYDTDRAVLFNEEKAFDSIIDEGLFPELSNAFLIMPESQLSYVKFSENRSHEFSIYTEITKEADRCRVRKYASDDVAKPHIAKLKQLEEGLKETYAEGGLSVASCHVAEDASWVEFEFIDGDSCADELYGFWRERIAFNEKLDEFVGLITSGSQQDFVFTDEFDRVFMSKLNECDIGRADAENLLQNAKSLDVTDIDLIPDNVITNQSGSYIIDYEWSFDFPVPVKFVVYRVIRYLKVSADYLYKRYNISEKELELFDAMEKSFQHYIEGDEIPLRELYSQASPGVVDGPSIINEEIRELREKRLQVFMFSPDGMRECREASVRFNGTSLETEIIIPEGVTDVRLDPGERQCICHVNRLHLEHEGEVHWDTVDGRRFGSDWVMLPHIDPQISFARKGRGEDKLLLAMDIYILEPEGMDALYGELPKLMDRVDYLQNKLDEQIRINEIRTEASLQEMANLRNRKVWKLYEKYLSKKGQTADIGQLFSYIDGAYYDSDEQCYHIVGWFASDADMGEAVKVYSGGQTLEYRLKRTARDDVKQGIAALKDRGDLGFEMSIPLDENQKYDGLRLNVLYGNGLNKDIFSLSGEELEKQIKEAGIKIFIDDAKTKKDMVHITGWAYSRHGAVNVRVVSDCGNTVDTELIWKERPDVNKNLKLEKGTKAGFVATFKRNAVGEKISLVFETGDISRQIDYDMAEVDLNGNYMLQYERAKKDVSYIKKYGYKQYKRHLGELLDKAETEYDVWFENHRVKEAELAAQRKVQFEYAPKISICIPLYNTPIKFLKAIVDSIVNQSYSNWELCLADGSTKDEVGEYIKASYAGDKRIIYERLAENKGIAGNTNASLAMATGEFVMLSDHDDVLELDALYEIVSAINKDKNIEIIYTDEDLTDETGEIFSSPRFKPDYNREMLCSINYICHIFMVKKHIIDEVGGFREEFDGAQDWDLILRCCEKSEHICHIPRVLYHWRAHEASTAGNPESKTYAIDAGRRALEEHYKRVGLEAELVYTDIFIMFRSIMKIKGEPKVSILIPNKDARETLDTCVQSILKKSTYQNYEIVIIENNSTEDETFAYYKELEAQDSRIKTVFYEGDFNYSKINNFGAEAATGDYYILLNNDTEVIEPTWIEELLGYCQMDDVGIVGAKLLYPDDTVQHCGAVIGLGGFAGHILTNSKADDAGYFGWLKAIHDVSAVTAACLMIKRSSYEAVGGLTEEFKVALNDMDLCLKVRALGQKVVVNPWAKLYHYESKTRGFEETPEKHERFKAEIKRFRDKWSDILTDGDPYYNPNLTLMYGDCSIRGKHEHFDIVEEIEE